MHHKYYSWYLVWDCRYVSMGLQIVKYLVFQLYETFFKILISCLSTLHNKFTNVQIEIWIWNILHLYRLLYCIFTFYHNEVKTFTLWNQYFRRGFKSKHECYVFSHFKYLPLHYSYLNSSPDFDLVGILTGLEVSPIS